MLLLTLLLACHHAPPETPVPPPIAVAGWDGISHTRVIAALEAAGAVPVEIMEGHLPAEAHGLVLPGGMDLDPLLYGELRGEDLVLEPLTRQHQDLSLAREALTTGVPVLGICLGAQELVVARGGSLVQHIPYEYLDAFDHREVHEVRLEEPLASWYGSPRVKVTSLHHQSADPTDLGQDLSMAAQSLDSVVEAVVAEDHPFAVGVQYHPELQVGDPLFRQLVAAAIQHREEPAPGLPPVDLPLLEPVPACEIVHSPLPDTERRSMAALQKRVTSSFGNHRASYVSGHKHAGIDLRLGYEQPVLAICPGRVVDMHLGFPHRTVVVEHTLADDTVRWSSYKHIIEEQVEIGQIVDEHTVVGRMFSEEEQERAPWRGVHLHFELRTSIADHGTASWTSMSQEELEEYAMYPLDFFEEHLE